MKFTFWCEVSGTEKVNKQIPNKQYDQRDISTMKNIIIRSKGQRETRVVLLARNIREGDV